MLEGYIEPVWLEDEHVGFEWARTNLNLFSVSRSKDEARKEKKQYNDAN